MSADLERLLHDTAVEPEQHPDPARLVARGRRRRRTRRAVAGAGAALAVLAVAVVVAGVLPDDRPMIVDQPSPDARPSPTAAPPEADLRPVAAGVADRAAGAAVGGFGSVWFAGPYDPRRETADVVRASPDGSSLEAIVTVPVRMSHLAVTDDALWAVSVGDGGVPQNVLVRIDPDTNEVVDEIDLGAFSTAGMVTTDTGDLLLVSGNGHPAEAVWVSGDTGEIAGRVIVDGLESAHAVAYRGGTVAVADFDTSSVLVVDEKELRAGDLPPPVRVPYSPTDVTFSADGGLWVASLPQTSITVLDRATWSVAETFLVPRAPIAAADTADGSAIVVTQSGAIMGEDGDGHPVVVWDGPFETGVAAVAADRVWLVADRADRGIVSVDLRSGPSDAAPLDRDERPTATMFSSEDGTTIVSWWVAMWVAIALLGIAGAVWGYRREVAYRRRVGVTRGERHDPGENYVPPPPPG